MGVPYWVASVTAHWSACGWLVASSYSVASPRLVKLHNGLQCIVQHCNGLIFPASQPSDLIVFCNTFCEFVKQSQPALASTSSQWPAGYQLTPVYPPWPGETQQGILLYNHSQGRYCEYQFQFHPIPSNPHAVNCSLFCPIPSIKPTGNPQGGKLAGIVIKFFSRAPLTTQKSVQKMSE